jgi:hypothetical protein
MIKCRDKVTPRSRKGAEERVALRLSAAAVSLRVFHEMVRSAALHGSSLDCAKETASP